MSALYVKDLLIKSLMIANHDQTVAHQILKIHGNRLSIIKIYHEVKMKLLLSVARPPLYVSASSFSGSCSPTPTPLKTQQKNWPQLTNEFIWVFRKLFLK